MAYTSLKQWNSSLSKQYIASTILQCCYVVFGLFGNILVILMYRFKMRGQKEDRFFIPVLAVVDLTGCLTSASLSLAQNLFPVMFPSGVLCKFLFFSTSVTIISSLLLLFVISIQRYQKICQPFGWQMSECHKYCCVAATVFCAAMLSVPVILLYGDHPINKDNITGVTCSAGTGKHSDLAVYNYIILTLECILVGIMTFLYFLVGKRVFYSFKSMKSYRRNFSISKNSNAAVHCPSEDESFISKDSADEFNKEEKVEEEKVSTDNQSKTENKPVVKDESKPPEPVSILVCNASTQTMPRRGTKKSLSIDTSHEMSMDLGDETSEICPGENETTDCPAGDDDGPVFTLESDQVGLGTYPCTEELETVYEDSVPEDEVGEKVIKNGGPEKPGGDQNQEVTRKLRKQSSSVSLGGRRNQSTSALAKQRNQSITSFGKCRNQSAPSLSKLRQQSVSSFNKDRKASNVDSLYSNKSSCAAHRYTIMFIVISFVAIVTYIPPWIFIIMETQDHEFWGALTYGESVTFLIIRRIYIINHVVNPVIYGLFDGRFRYTLKRMLCPKMNTNV